MDKNEISLFLSYGRDEEHKPVVDELKAALTNEFKSCWIDVEQIPEQSDWRREIVQAIGETSLTVALLSEYSTRDRSVCLDELGISVTVPERRLITVLLDPHALEKLPSTVTRGQYTDLSRWREYIGTDGWEAYFTPRMETVIAHIKNPVDYDFQGEITTLRKALNPEPLDKRARRYLVDRHPVDRPELTGRIKRWLEDPSSGRILLVTGDPGLGKSHLSAWFQHYEAACLAAVYCEHDKINRHFVKNVVLHLVYTIATKLPDYRYQLLGILRDAGLISPNGDVREDRCAGFFESHTAAALLDRLLAIPMIDGSNQSYAILIDALDEAAEGEENPLADFLCSDLIGLLPSNIRFVVTSRAEPAIMAKLAGARPQIIALDRDACDLDIERYIRIRTKGRTDVREADIPHLVERCEGMFLYAELMCDMLDDGGSTEDLRRMPRGLGGRLCGYFDRLFRRAEDLERCRPYLRILCAYDVGDLSEALLMRATRTGREELNRFYLTMRSLARRVTVDGKSDVSLFHRSMYEWLKDPEASGRYCVDVEAGRREILRLCDEVIERADRTEKLTILKSVYQYVEKHGSLARLRPEFLYAMQCSANDNSDIPLYREMVRRIAEMADFTGEKRIYILSRLDLAGWYYDSVREREDAHRLLRDLYERYRDTIDEDPEIHAESELTYVYLESSRVRDETPEGHPEAYAEVKARAEELIRYIRQKKPEELPSRLSCLARAYHYLSLIEFRMGDGHYEACIQTEEDALRASEYGYADPRRMKCLIYVVQAAALRRIDEFERAAEVLETSLEYRLSLYDPCSLYVANSLNSLIDTYIKKASARGEPADRRIGRYIADYRRAVAVSVGETDRRMIQYHYHMFRYAELEGDRETAVKHAREALLFGDVPGYDWQLGKAREILQKYAPQ
ncbi:MAG: toll/interleukin-1 receptor domain-containing protein [Clostridia bacterium]|nr:toll/interleukin-1 receptor domain-containing protein [Clostridia bacterium]